MAPASGTGGCLRRRPAPLAAGLFPAALENRAQALADARAAAEVPRIDTFLREVETGQYSR